MHYNVPMRDTQTLEVPIQGMDCAECTRHVQHAIAQVPGVYSVEVYLASEKAIIQHEPDSADISAIRKAVASAGYVDQIPCLDLSPSPTSL